MEQFQTFLSDGLVLSRENFLNELHINNFPIYKNSKSISYYNVPCAFDIETSKFIYNNTKHAIMYEWTFGFNGMITIGRSWCEYIDFIEKFVKILKLSDELRVICFVHNLGYDFQFFNKWFEFKKVFASDTHKPIYALGLNGIEYRCSYFLTGKKLEQIAIDLQKFNVKKMVGDLDYKKIRHSETPLSQKELRYCYNDVLVIMCLIQEKILNERFVFYIPLTKTGYVRKFLKKTCLYNGSHKNSNTTYSQYRKIIQNLNLTPDEYRKAKRAFQGGFVHANVINVNKLLYNVSSFDETSAYPAALCCEQYPMSKGEEYIPKNEKDFYNTIKCYNCIFDIEIFNLESVFVAENPISISHCFDCKKIKENNGRIVSATHIITTITEQDFFVYQKFYKWSNFRVSNLIRYEKNYLPKKYIEAVLTLYADKTALKGVDGSEVNYMLKKELLNAFYGCCVTDIVRDSIIYENGNWIECKQDEEEQIEKYNNKKDRTLSYLWGVYCTAYARRNLFSVIYGICRENENDYVYADTDSVKYLNKEAHEHLFDEYNALISQKIKEMAEYYNIPKEKFCPKTKNGIEKPLGIFEDETPKNEKYTYEKFKTLGAKRYMYFSQNEYHLTFAGLSKKSAIEYIVKKAEKKNISPFDLFNNNLYLPKKYSGKMACTYSDEECCGSIVDYKGNKFDYYEKSYAYLDNVDYSVSIGADFANYINEINDRFF